MKMRAVSLVDAGRARTRTALPRSSVKLVDGSRAFGLPSARGATPTYNAKIRICLCAQLLDVTDVASSDKRFGVLEDKGKILAHRSLPGLGLPVLYRDEPERRPSGLEWKGSLKSERRRRSIQLARLRSVNLHGCPYGYENVRGQPFALGLPRLLRSAFVRRLPPG